VFPFCPLCGFIEEFGQKGVVRVQIWQKPAVPNLPEGLWGWNGTNTLFPLGAEHVLPLGQVKPKVFDDALANLGLFLRNVVSCLPHKKDKEAILFHTVFLG
jgi:hypothetical protein